MKQNGRALWLLAALAVVAGYYLWSQASGGSGPGGSPRGRGRGSLGVSAAEQVAELDLARLEQKPGTHPAGRDLFAYGRPERPQPVRRPPPTEVAPPPTPPPTQVAPQPPRPLPPPVDVAYLGSFGRPDSRIAVFADAEGVYNARVGDVIKDKFLLETIGYESVDLSFVGFPDASPQRVAVGGSQ